MAARTSQTRSPGCKAYQEAGADVLFAPGVSRLEDIRQLVAAVDRPVNVLALSGAPAVAMLSRPSA